MITMSMLERVTGLVKRISLDILNHHMVIQVHHDKKAARRRKPEPRVYIQVLYSTKCTHTRLESIWKGGKWYLSEHMTNDEIVKKCYLAFRTCIEHEVLESFRVDGVAIFNPHTNFEELIKIANLEVTRSDLQIVQATE